MKDSENDALWDWISKLHVDLGKMKTGF